jgi:hypothetical protein
MFVTTFAAFAASSVLFAGTICGPDYDMVFGENGNAHIEFNDGTHADVLFYRVTIEPNNIVASGVVVKSTSPSHMKSGDNIALSNGYNTLSVISPDEMTIRMNSQACWQGFNNAGAPPTRFC